MWRKKSTNVILGDHLVSFLDELAKRLPHDIVVTSGDRTPQQQAQAVYTKIELGDDITKIYSNKDYARAMIEAYPDLARMADISATYAPTPHLKGEGVDIRTSDLTSAQVQNMQAVAQAMGAQAIIETTPPHLHLTVKKNGYNLDDTKKTILPLLIRFGAIWIIKRLFR